MATATKSEKGRASDKLDSPTSVALHPLENTAWDSIAGAMGLKPSPMIRIAMREFAEKYQKRHRVDLSKLPPIIRLDS